MNNTKILICIGTGGVGKTTMAAALGYKFALEGKKTLLLTIDPSYRLASTLNIKKNNSIQKLNTTEGLELYGSIIEPEAIFNDFVESSAKSDTAKSKIKTNLLYQQLSTRLNASQEFTSLVKLIDCSNSPENYDLIILDTPPAQHIFDFLNSPKKIQKLFNNKIFRTFTNDSSFNITKIMSQGTKKLLSILDKLTGKSFVEELYLFFGSLKSIQKDILKKCIDAEKLLASSNTRFVLVSGADINNIEDAKVLSEEMKANKFKLDQIIFNKVAPEWALDENSAVLPNSSSTDKIIEFYKKRIENCNNFESKHCKIEILPDLINDLCNLNQIKSIVNKLKSLN